MSRDSLQTLQRIRNGALIMVVAIAAFFALSSLPASSKEPGIYIQWLFSYEFGLIKRGLVGHILINWIYPAAERIGADDLFLLTSLISLATVVLYALLGLRVWRWRAAAGEVQEDWLVTLMLIGILIATPIGVTYYVENSHYLEVVLLFLLGLFAHAILFLRSQYIALPALLIFCLVSAFVHEAALLSTIPIALGVYYGAFARCEGDTRLATLLGAVYGVSLVLILTVGGQPVAEQIVTHVSSRVQFPIDAHYALVVERSLADNLRYTFGEYRHLKGGSRIILSLLVVLPGVAFLVNELRVKYSHRVGYALVAIGLLPIALGTIADDVYRWYVLVIVGLSVLQLMPVNASLGRVERHAGAPAVFQGQVRLGLGVLALVAATALPYPYFHGTGANPLFATLVRFWRDLSAL